MKYLIISDIHGSLDSMKYLEEKFIELKCDKIICLGDILYHGPRNDLPMSYNPKEVIKIVDKLRDNFIWVKGNCDAEVDEMVLKMNALERYMLSINHRDVIFVHGHHLSKYDIDYSLKKLSVIIHGHYHVFDISDISDYTFISIGSASIPKDNKMQYGILDDNRIVIFDFNDFIIGEYNI